MNGVRCWSESEKVSVSSRTHQARLSPKPAGSSGEACTEIPDLWLRASLSHSSSSFFFPILFSLSDVHLNQTKRHGHLVGLDANTLSALAGG